MLVLVLALERLVWSERIRDPCRRLTKLRGQPRNALPIEHADEDDLRRGTHPRFRRRISSRSAQVTSSCEALRR